MLYRPSLTSRIRLLYINLAEITAVTLSIHMTGEYGEEIKWQITRKDHPLPMKNNIKNDQMHPAQVL